jgi:hypothetical protein
MQLPALPGEQLVRDLDQYSGAVAGLRIAAASAAMRKIDQNLDSLGDDIVGSVAVNVHDEADATRVTLVPGMIQARWRGQTLRCVVVEHDGKTRFLSI